MLPVAVFGAADCDVGTRVATDIFTVAEQVSAREQCLDLRVSIPVHEETATDSSTNSGDQETATDSSTDSGDSGKVGDVLNQFGSMVIRVGQGTSKVVNKVVRTAKYAGCSAYDGFSNFSSSMVSAWNGMASNKWATIGPRQIEFGAVQEGTVVNPTKRTFVSAMPLDSDSVSVALTKKGGRAKTEIVVCGHSPSGSTRQLHKTVVDRGNDSFTWSPQRTDGVLDHVISVQIAPITASLKFGYTLQVNKGPVVQPVPETVTATATPEEVPIQTSGGTTAGLPGPSVSGPEIQTLPDGSLPQGSATGGAIVQGTAIPAPAPTADSGPDVTAANVPSIHGVESEPAAGGTLPLPNPLDDAIATLPAQPETNSGQCMVSSTMRFPDIRLRCGMSVRDETIRVREDFMGDCPLVAGDMVNVGVAEGGKQLEITGRVSGGEWCGVAYPPGYYTGPCEATETESSTTLVKTLFFRGKRIVGRVLPGACNEAKLGPGIYRVVSERRDGAPGRPTQYSLREGGLRLEGDDAVGDLTNMLSAPVVQR